MAKWGIGFRMLLVALGYLLLAASTLQLAVPPGYSVPVWPAAGLALAAVLTWGPVVLPGILLASFLVNALLIGDASMLASSPVAWLVPAVIAVGASLQAHIGAQLVLLVTRPPWSLDTMRQVGAIILLGGVLASMIAPTLAQIALAAAGYVDPAAIAGNWIAWWAGDCVGVALLTPVLLLLASALRGRSWWRLGMVSLVMLIGLLGLVAVVSQLVGSQRERLNDDMRFAAAQMEASASTKVQRFSMLLLGLERYFHSSEYVSFAEFVAYGGPLEAKIPSVEALQWLPRVEQSRRKSFEASGRELHGPAFRLLQMDGARYVPADVFDTYFPVLYVTPLSGNRRALGYVVNSDPASNDLLERALLYEDRAAAGVVKLVQAGAPIDAVVIARPVIRGSDLTGYVQLVAELDDITIEMDHIADKLGANLLIKDIASDELIHARYESRTTQPPGEPALDSFAGSVSFDIKVADRTWLATLWLPPAAGAERLYAGVYVTMVAGTLMASLLGLIALLVSGERQAIAREVESKTRELAIANKKLETLSGTDVLTGIANRRRFEEELQREWRRAMRDKEPVTVAMLDLDYFKVINDTRGHAFGDSCLQRVATAISECLGRAGDLCGRYGGEEFVVFFARASTEAAMMKLEEMRHAVEKLGVQTGLDDHGGKLTISIGFAQADPGRDRAADWTRALHAADNALYEAKARGRNCVVMSEEVNLDT